MNYLMLLASAYLVLVNSRLDNISYNESEWKLFKQEHEKNYENEGIEMIKRTIFAYNKFQVEKFNKEQAQEAGFSLGINHLADMSEYEMQKINGFRLPELKEGSQTSSFRENSPEAQKFLDDILNDNSTSVPDELDWRQTSGRVSRVKNQGSCGSCWAFASTGALEGQEKIRPKSLLSALAANDSLIELSEQNLVDCVTDDAGCNGGFMADALNFVKQEGGIDDEQSYPYEGVTRTCRFKKDKVAFTDTGSAILPVGDEQKLKEVVAKFGPVAVAIDASSIWFQLYRHGVYYNKHCKNKQDQLDHGVLVVGYGTDPKKGDYWIVKNSWGTGYGEKGYIRMARNKNNNCGIATVATIPIFQK